VFNVAEDVEMNRTAMIFFIIALGLGIAVAVQASPGYSLRDPAATGVPPSPEPDIHLEASIFDVENFSAIAFTLEFSRPGLKLRYFTWGESFDDNGSDISIPAKKDLPVAIGYETYVTPGEVEKIDLYFHNSPRIPLSKDLTKILTLGMDMQPDFDWGPEKRLVVTLVPNVSYGAATGAQIIYTPKPFDMTQYWPLKPGTTWIFDREALIVGAKTHQFISYPGTQLIQSTTYCDNACGEHAYLYSGQDGILFIGYFGVNHIDFSDTPLKFAHQKMMINDIVVSTVPAGVLDDDAITCTATLLARESVTVPGGTFPDALVLQIRIDDSPNSHYIEKIWLAKGIGPVKIQRTSESPLNHVGCFFTCGSFDKGASEGAVAYREISLDNVFGPPIIDIHNDGKIGLEEVIYILQVISKNR